MIDEHISQKRISKLKSKVREILDAVPNNKEVLDWDAVK